MNILKLSSFYFQRGDGEWTEHWGRSVQPEEHAQMPSLSGNRKQNTYIKQYIYICINIK